MLSATICVLGAAARRRVVSGALSEVEARFFRDDRFVLRHILPSLLHRCAAFSLALPGLDLIALTAAVLHAPPLGISLAAISLPVHIEANPLLGLS